MKRRRHRPSRRAAGVEPEQVLHYDGPLPPGRTVHLGGSEADHALRSLRVRTGDPLCLADGRGGRHHGRVVGIDRGRLDLEITRSETLPVWPRRSFHLALGVLRSTRMDVAVEKASELGVERFVPLVLKHCVARPLEDGVKSDRWHRLAVASLKQSKRGVLMEVAEPRDLESFLAELPPVRSLWLADPEGEPPAALAAIREVSGPAVLVCGPEGGIAPEERRLLVERGAKRVSLGGNRLRAETAAVALAALALGLSGAMESAPES